MKSAQRLVIGNWKMNGGLASNQALLRRLLQGLQSDTQQRYTRTHVVVCAPFPYLAQMQLLLGPPSNGKNILPTISWGAQDISEHEQGAYTAEVSASMLKEFACTWAIVGHSERRVYHAESNESVARKAHIAVANGITPIVCVGESLGVREAGQTLPLIQQQLEPVLALGEQMVSSMVIAYEPVWAIGTGLTATPEQAQEVHAFIRRLLTHDSNVSILYGGSVNASNAADLFSMPDINGALVGGAALQAEEFLAIAAT